MFQVKIGKYIIAQTPDQLNKGENLFWMMLANNGEGMEITEKALEAGLDKIYKENF